MLIYLISLYGKEAPVKLQN